MSVCLQLINDFLTSLETYTTLEELREYYDREKLLNWLTRPSLNELNGGTISYAEIHSLETQEELDLAIDFLIACGIGNEDEQTQTVHARITGGNQLAQVNQEDRKEETRPVDSTEFLKNYKSHPQTEN